MRIVNLILSTFLLNTFQVYSGNWQFSLDQNLQSGDTIKIGLLIQSDTSTDARQGAGLAIRMANEAGGVNGRPLALVVRSMEGPWGTGSKQAVNLIFDENVVALLGSHDGRNAHLAEQVSAKARVVFMSAWTGDPTLAQAFVPWFYNCVPNYSQQAEKLVGEIIKRNFKKIAIVSDSSYDSQMAEKSILKSFKALNYKEPELFNLDNKKWNSDLMVDNIAISAPQCIILPGQPPASMKLINVIRQRKMNTTIFGNFTMMGERAVSDQELKDYNNVVMVSSGDLLNPQRLAFITGFKKTYGHRPGLAAEYAFDGMNLIIEAIRSGGTERELIQKSLSKIRYKGVTGSISFDNRGNRLGGIDLAEIKNGQLINLKKY